MHQFCLETFQTVQENVQNELKKSHVAESPAEPVNQSEQECSTYQRRSSSGGWQEGREVLVRVRVLVLVVVLMELKGQRRDPRLVLRCAA